jgi:hypothetical protein
MPSRPHRPFHEVTPSGERGCTVSTPGFLLRWLQRGCGQRRRSQPTEPHRLAWRIWERAHRQRHGHWHRTIRLQRWLRMRTQPLPAFRLRLVRPAGSPHKACATLQGDLASGVGCERGRSFESLAANELEGLRGTRRSLIFGQVQARLCERSLQWLRKRVSGLLSKKLG